MDAIILDTETTGTEDGAEVLQLAWRGFPLANETKNQFFFPSGRISTGALATHHILLSDLEGSPPSSEVCSHLPTEASYWIGHNIDFDWRMLGCPSGVKRICTLAMCRAVWPEADSHSLVAMMYYLFGQTEEVRKDVRGAHGADVDIYLCASILEHIMDAEGIDNLAQLYQFSEECRIPKIMTFGKYKGERIDAVDRGWANWYARQTDTDPYLLTALRRARKL